MMTATPANQGIRKAAIFVASLDRQAADLVLDQMQDEQAQAVRQAIMDLDPIDPQEQRTVLAEFRQHRAPSQLGPKKNAKTSEASETSGVVRSARSGVEIDASLAKRFAPPPLEQKASPSSGPRPSGPPFRFLCEAELDKLVRVLVAERPQTIALVLSHLPPVHAGNVLARLESGLQADVVRRLVDLEETDPEILREVERGLQARLSEQVHMQRRRVAGLAAVAGILDACDQDLGAQILDNLNIFDQPLAERLAPTPVEVKVDFDDLLTMSDETLATTLHNADAELVFLALVGAPPSLIERFLRLIPEAQARQVRHELAHLGPTRLSDVEEARERLAELAGQLAVQGRIRLPETGRMPVLA